MVNSVAVARSIGRYCDGDFDVVLKAVEGRSDQSHYQEFPVVCIQNSLDKLHKLVGEFSKVGGGGQAKHGIRKNLVNLTP